MRKYLLFNKKWRYSFHFHWPLCIKPYKLLEQLVFIILDLYYEQSAKAEAETVREQLREAQSEAISLRSMTQRMILTQEEMVGASTINLL